MSLKEFFIQPTVSY
jgi:long-subunit fatty acid transport protein